MKTTNVYAEYVAQTMKGFVMVRTDQVHVQYVSARTMAAICRQRRTMACSQSIPV